MSSRSKPNREANTPMTGSTLMVKKRKLQRNGASLYSNLTEFGVDYLNVSEGEEVYVQVCEHGIWITTEEQR